MGGQYTVKPAEVNIQYSRLGFGDSTMEKISHEPGQYWNQNYRLSGVVWILESSGGVWIINERKHFWFLAGTSE